MMDCQCRNGRRWHMSQGKMRVEWFRKWCKGETTLTQLCPGVWAGGSLAAIEIIKYVTGKWRQVTPPKMWQLELGDNRIKAVGFRRRTWLFSKFIYRAFNTDFLGIGKAIRKLYACGAGKRPDAHGKGRKRRQGASPAF